MTMFDEDDQMTGTPTVERPMRSEIPKQSPVIEYIRGLPFEAKQVALLTLLREAMEVNGDTGLLPIDDEQGNPFGYYVPPKAAAERTDRYGPKLTAEQEQEIERRVEKRNTAMPMSEVITDLKSQLAERQHRPL